MIFVTDLEGNEIIINERHIITIQEQDFVMEGKTGRARVISVVPGNNIFPIKETMQEITDQLTRERLYNNH